MPVYYPAQDANAADEPPWCVRRGGDIIAILDTPLVNPWNASDGPGLTLNGCDFTGIDRKHILRGPLTRSTLVSGTRPLGPLEVANVGKGKVVTGRNIEE